MAARNRLLPWHEQIRLSNGRDVLIRPIRPADADPLRHLLGLTPAGKLSGAEVDHWQHCLDEAWHILVRRHRAAAETLAAVLRVIVPVQPDPAAEGISATSAEAFGAVAMSAPADGTAAKSFAPSPW